MAAEISNPLTTSAEVKLTTPGHTGDHLNNNGQDTCDSGHGDNSIVAVDVPNGDHSGDADFDRFDDLELGAEDGAVPLGDILDKFEAASTNGLVATEETNADTAISATVNVSTLDLSDPESIHRHLSQLNDTVLKVSTACIRLNHNGNEDELVKDYNGRSSSSSGDFPPHASTSTPPQTPSPTTATAIPSSAAVSASSPKPPLPPPSPLETLPSGTRSIRTFIE